jgi:hypothetical protein
MDTDTRRTRMLRDIIEVSKAMLVMARDNEWERVALLEAERRVMVQSCFAHTTREQDAPHVAAAIKEILRLNQDVASLAGSWKEQIGADIHAQKVGRSAAAVYRSHAG